MPRSLTHRAQPKQRKQRDPEIPDKKGQSVVLWHEDAHRCDSKTKLIHSIAVTPANTHDSQVLEDLLHGDETRIWGDSAYAGQKKSLSCMRQMPKILRKEKPIAIDR